MPKLEAYEAVEEFDPPEIKVRLMGRVADLCDKCGTLQPNEIRVSLKQTKDITPRSILKELADQNPLLNDQIMRRDGTPRSSTRILLNGKPPSDLDQKMELRRSSDGSRQLIIVVVIDGTVIIITDVVIIVFVPCDG